MSTPDGGDLPGRYSFRFVPAKEPDEVPELMHSNDRVLSGVGPARISRDGSLLLGYSEYVFASDDGQTTPVREAVIWTEAYGTRAVPYFSSGSCMAPDGAWLIGGEVLSQGKIHRVEATGESVLLEFERQSEVEAALVDGCATDGSVVAGVAEFAGASAFVPVLWRRGMDADRFVDLTSQVGLRTPSEVLLSADGERLVIHFSDPDTGNGTLYVLGTGADRTPLLVSFPPGYASCAPRFVSRDGTVVVGECFDASRTAFRWRQGDPQVTLVQGLFHPHGMSPDGEVLLGYSQEGYLAAESGGNVTAFDSNGAWAGMTGEGEGVVAFGTLEVVQAARPVRWTAATGFVELDVPPGRDTAGVVGVGDDGTLAVGMSPHSSPQVDGARAVLWDAFGAREISEELRENGVDLLGAEKLEPRWVFVAGTTIRVIGSAETPGPPARCRRVGRPTWSFPRHPRSTKPGLQRFPCATCRRSGRTDLEAPHIQRFEQRRGPVLAERHRRRRTSRSSQFEGVPRRPTLGVCHNAPTGDTGDPNGGGLGVPGPLLSVCSPCRPGTTR